MHLVNGWTRNRQWDKFKVGLRVSYLTVFCIDIDVSGHVYNFTLFNFRLELGQ
jgi:hypothetical protein